MTDNNRTVKDGVGIGLLVSLGSELATALLLWAGLGIANKPVMEHLRWFAACFIAPVVILRFFAKSAQRPVATKTIMVVLFLTFLAFMALLMRNGGLGLGQ